jgi:hypothetical protein
MQQQSGNQSERIEFDMGLSKFEETISGNFKVVQSMFAQQRSEIDRLSAALEEFKKQMTLLNKNNGGSEVKDGVYNEKIDTSG